MFTRGGDTEWLCLRIMVSRSRPPKNHTYLLAVRSNTDNHSLTHTRRPHFQYPFQFYTTEQRENRHTTLIKSINVKNRLRCFDVKLQHFINASRRVSTSKPQHPFEKLMPKY